MHITRIELEDIKSHAHFSHEFQRGTTAITGENGAGKTTLIEAVAWTLFDFLDYRKDDFVRRGAKKGVARVTFESGLDEREYLVYRDSGTGYYVYDPRLKTRIADKKEEVTRFLWQHLGVEPGTDLESLFRRAIGVPQGTFTAIFLETPAERKKAFDKLLKVEEYRQGADKLLETSRYIESQISSVRERIARAEGELSRIEMLEEEFKSFAKAVKELTSSNDKFSARVQSINEVVSDFEKKEQNFNILKTSVDKLHSELAKAGIQQKQILDEKNRAIEANDKIKSVEADYKSHVDALGKLKELDRERVERDKINAELNRIETAQTNVKADYERVREKLDATLKAHKEIKELEPNVKEQEDLEKRLEILRNSLAKANAAESTIKSLDAKLGELREKYSKNKNEIRESEEKSKDANLLSQRQARDIALTNDLAKFRAKLESDRKFQEEIKNGLCPILSEKCLNLKPGQTLETFVSNQFTEISAQISSLETEQKSLDAALRSSREAENFLAKLETLRNREQEIAHEGKQLSEEKEAMEKTLGDLETLKTEITEIENGLKALGNPKAKIAVLQSGSENEIILRDERTKIEKNLERLQNDHGILVQQLESYRFLDSNWKEYTEVREKTAGAHRQYIANEELAKSLPIKEKDFDAAAKESKLLRVSVAKAEKELKTAEKDYDLDEHLKAKANLLDAERTAAETKANLENAKRREDETRKELDRLAAVRKSMQQEFEEKEKLEKIGEATKFIRDTLKEAAPRVAQNYVFHVAIEANQMFREISGNAERTLKWSDDYGIFLEEDGYERPFVSFSGGEQMAAALSVRLALLKQLSDVRLAFFDEPTTNMDLERRERLAEQISLITEKQTFDQLFVISHDDTFEGYADNVVTVRTNEAE